MKISKEAKIGLMGTIALIVLFFGINFLKGMSIFSNDAVYYLQFKNAKGLTKNSTVFADGFDIGRVSDVRYDYMNPGKVIVEISVDRSLRIPKACKVALDEAMLGGCTLNMHLTGSVKDAYAEGDTIIGDESNGLMEKASAMIPQVEPILAKMDSLLAALNRIAADPALAQILHNAEELTANLNQSSIQLNKLLAKDMPQMAKTFNQAGENIVTLTNNLNQLDLQTTLNGITATVNNVNNMIAQMQNPQGTLGKFMNDPTLYNNLSETANSANELMKDLKARPKRYVHFSVFGKKEE
ncbi:MAG: MlaD family protein [Bacteroidaceae bacterium]|nr:MlaD family protein [Bacteroidaceae bacterium]